MTKKQNPLLHLVGLPPFQAIKAEHVESAADQMLAEHRQRINELLEENSDYSWDNFVQPMEEMDEALGRMWSPVSHLHAVRDSEEMEGQLADLLDGYCQFAEFNQSELILIEPLRTLRLLHYNAWLAQRWTDPAFPRNFPWFDSVRYWEQQVLTLREQAALLSEPALNWQR